MKFLDGVGSRDGLTGGRWDCPAKGGECVRCLDDRLFRGGDFRCGAVCGIKAPRVCHAIPSGTRHVETQAPIMLWSWANIVRIGSVRCPAGPVRRIFIN